MSNLLFLFKKKEKDVIPALETRFVENMITKMCEKPTTLVVGEVHYETVSNSSVSDQLNELFQLLNQAHRPTAKTTYSLSIGDIIEVDQTYYMVDTFGFHSFKY